YEEQLKVARIQILSQALKKVIDEEASQISDKEISGYYQSNITSFEKAEMDRLFVPRTQQSALLSFKDLADVERHNRLEASEKIMKGEADQLRIRALTGEEFAKLQTHAYQVGGVKSGLPSTRLTIRRISLPPNQVLAMDLKPGEVSPVLEDANGYVVYRVKSKETLSLEQVRDEIKAILRLQRMEAEMRKIQESASATLDESYFKHSQG